MTSKTDFVKNQQTLLQIISAIGTIRPCHVKYNYETVRYMMTSTLVKTEYQKWPLLDFKI